MGGDMSEGNWVEPIVLEGTKFDSPSFHEEFFCPVFNLYKVQTE
jgi:acyl-CoA reductase-like NAD-dependent aldehyde dehydrogenase